MSTVRINARFVRGIVPADAGIAFELAMTTQQRFEAVEQLLGVGMPEQVAYEGLRKLFPEWFDEALLNARAEPEVRDSTWGEFQATQEAA